MQAPHNMVSIIDKVNIINLSRLSLQSLSLRSSYYVITWYTLAL